MPNNTPVLQPDITLNKKETEILTDIAIGTTVASAIACHEAIGKNNATDADKKATESARNYLNRELSNLGICGTIVIGEGERDEAPMLFINEKVGINADKHNDKLTVSNIEHNYSYEKDTEYGAGVENSEVENSAIKDDSYDSTKIEMESAKVDAKTGSEIDNEKSDYEEVAKMHMKADVKMEIDIAIDPLECTTSCAENLPNSITVVAMSKRGGLLNAPDVYMNKIATAINIPEGTLHINNTVEQNIGNLAKFLNIKQNDIGVCILNRPRHKDLINKCNAIGVKIHLIEDGDILGILQTAQYKTNGVHLYLGIGGAPEGVIAAAALTNLGGFIQGVLTATNASQEGRLKKFNINHNDKTVLEISDMAKGDCVFAATAVTDINMNILSTLLSTVLSADILNQLKERNSSDKSISHNALQQEINDAMLSDDILNDFTMNEKIPQETKLEEQANADLRNASVRNAELENGGVNDESKSSQLAGKDGTLALQIGGQSGKSGNQSGSQSGAKFYGKANSISIEQDITHGMQKVSKIGGVSLLNGNNINLPQNNAKTNTQETYEKAIAGDSADESLKYITNTIVINSQSAMATLVSALRRS